MKETISSHPEINEGRLYAGFNINYLSLVNIADATTETGPFDIELFEGTVLDHRYSALFGLSDVNKHFSGHICTFSALS